ncbi:hypothetical protein RhiirC2_786076 [Rhizophagus irregularis]|uniref:DNase I-like protein n=1 Tax=Rhizophagus irregularis TaxID=588596 RepID=A0A2N1MV28_9GLOM|nr:hypothetical protein RhiirC2_786076 [Rhizophagus irregularis]
MVTNISSSFNLKIKKISQKNQKNSENSINQKKDNNIINISSSSSSNNNIINHNTNIITIDDPSLQPGFINYSDIISDYKQLAFATHNIKGGFKKKKDNIITMMIEQHIDFLHVCETNERDNNFDISKSKAHIKYITPIDNEFSNTFIIINNPNETNLGGGSCIIMTERLHNHLESTKIVQQGRYITNVFNFKNKKKFHIHSIYLPDLDKHKEIHHNITKSLFELLIQQPNKINHVTLILGDFNISNLYTIKSSLKNKNIEFLKNCIRNTHRTAML